MRTYPDHSTSLFRSNAACRIAGALVIALALGALSACEPDPRVDPGGAEVTDMEAPGPVPSQKPQGLSAACLLRETFSSAPASLTVTGIAGGRDQRAMLDDSHPNIPGGQRKIVLRVDAAQTGTATVTTESQMLRLSEANLASTILELSYGASAFPPADRCGFGPMLGLDLTQSRGLLLEFGAIVEPVTVDVIYYTSVALNPANPVFFARGTLTVDPNKSGKVVFVPSYDDAEFNWAKMDGLHLSLGVHTPAPSASFELRSIGAGCP